MARRWWLWLLGIGLIPFLLWGCDGLFVTYWVGRTDLEVEFAVTEAGSERAIADARIEVESEGGFYEEREKQRFYLRTDANGLARKECRSSMCFGTQSGLRFTDTYVVHLPWWRFRVSKGFERTEWVDLDVPKYIQQVQRIGPGKAKLVVPVSLRPQPDE